MRWRRRQETPKGVFIVGARCRAGNAVLAAVPADSRQPGRDCSPPSRRKIARPSRAEPTSLSVLVARRIPYSAARGVVCWRRSQKPEPRTCRKPVRRAGVWRSARRAACNTICLHGVWNADADSLGLICQMLAAGAEPDIIPNAGRQRAATRRESALWLRPKRRSGHLQPGWSGESG